MSVCNCGGSLHTVCVDGIYVSAKFAWASLSSQVRFVHFALCQFFLLTRGPLSYSLPVSISHCWTLPHSSCCCCWCCSGHTWSLLQDIQLGRLAAASSCSLLLAAFLFLATVFFLYFMVISNVLSCVCVCALWCAHKYLVLINFYKYSLWHF